MKVKDLWDHVDLIAACLPNVAVCSLRRYGRRTSDLHMSYYYRVFNMPLLHLLSDLWQQA